MIAFINMKGTENDLAVPALEQNMVFMFYSLHVICRFHPRCVCNCKLLPFRANHAGPI